MNGSGRRRLGIVRFGRWPIRVQLLFGPSLLLLLLLLTVWVAFAVLDRVERSAREVQSTDAVLEEGEWLLKLVLDEETGVRGFALARDQSFLAPFLQAQSEFQATYRSLRAQVAPFPEQAARLDRVAAIMDDWETNVAQVIIQSTLNGQSVNALVRSGTGKRRMDAIRSEMQSFLTTQRALLDVRARRDAAQHRTARLILALVSVVALLAAAGVLVSIFRIMQHIRAFTAAARQMAEGDLDAQLQIQGDNDLAETARTFNRMAESVRTARDRLLVMNEALERQAAAEREVSRVKDEFISLVSHELRTPLTSIKGFVDLLLEGEVGDLSAEQREFLTIVRNNADREVSLVNDLLDISRIESGKVELLRTAVDLGTIIRTVAAGMRAPLEAKAQHLALELPPDLPRVDADANRVTQVLTNLLSNAHKYTPAGGTITIAAQGVDSDVQVDVRDTGIGLTEEEQTHLFQKFFRAKNRTTEEVGGTGLGLAITRQLVELHGGEIWVTSAPGEGATFSFTLPQAGAGQLPALERGPGAAVLPDTTILVVDDEPDIGQLLRRYLLRAGYTVRVARTAAEALRISRTEPPNLVLLDLLLPDGNGLEVLAALKQRPETADVPVILLSVVADSGEAAALGAVAYLTKPVNGPEVVERVKQVLTEAGAGPTGSELAAVESTGGNRY